MDAREKGGVMVSVNTFFPNAEALESQSLTRKHKKNSLELFVTIETYLTEVYTSLQIAEKYNKDYDEYLK